MLRAMPTYIEPLYVAIGLECRHMRIIDRPYFGCEDIALGHLVWCAECTARQPKFEPVHCAIIERAEFWS